MDTIQRFFALLRSGLWGKAVDSSLFADGETDWDAIISMSMEQTVTALVFDGMETLPPALRPSKTDVMRWFSMVVRVEQSNKLLDRELANIVEFYRGHSIFPILLKGQGVASLYPRPEHRQCGDIDLYLGDDYERAKELIASQGIKLGDEGEKHVSYSYNGAPVENHHYAVCFYNPRQNRILQRWAKEWLSAKTKTFHVRDTEVLLPAPGFDAIYLLIHALLHFIPEGIGLRQVCDWTLILKTYHRQIDQERLIGEVRLLKIEDAFRTFGYVAVHYLGLPAECIPFPLDNVAEAGEFLLHDILEGGNFGKMREEDKKLPQGKWGKVWYNYKHIHARCKKMKVFCREEARWYPYFRALNLVYKKLHGLD